MAAAEDLPQDLVFVDLETTGANAALDRITEVAVVRVGGDGATEEWSSLVNPERPISSHIESITGINDQMVANAPRFADIACVVRDKLRGAVFVAHNARFDYSFLRSEFLKLDMSFSAKVLCTVKLSRRLFPEHARHNLDAVMERNGLTCSARHRALGDAQVIRDFWLKLRREIPLPRLNSAVHAALGSHSLPAHLPSGLADEIPEGPGIYRLYAEDSALLYVGKADSLRARVCAHFAAEPAGANGRRLSQEARNIEWTETAGELGAALLEAQWFKTRAPRYNRHHRNPLQCFTLRFRRSAGATQGEHCVAAVPADAVQAEQLPDCYGLFHSEKEALKALADIARARGLCQAVLGLEPGEGSCLAHQVGKCKGACVGKEPLILHDMRARLALSSLKLKPWPFPGRIAIREAAGRGGARGFDAGADLHVIDHWTYLGTARGEEQLAALAEQRVAPGFDADAYRILIRHVTRHPKLDWLDLRPEARRP